MSDYTRKISIYVDSGQAQVAYDRLSATQKKLTEDIRKYTDAGKDVPTKLTAKLNEVNKALETQGKILSGQLSPSLKDLQGTYSNLSRELARMRQEDPGFEQKKQQTIAAKQALDGYRSSLTSVAEGFRNMMKEAKGIAVGVLIGNTVQAAVQSLSGAFTGFISGAAKVSDELADIEKTTNLTKDAIKQLNKELSQEDTRTSSSKLREYAAEAGKLGKESVEDVKRFVLEANQIDVALGEDLGQGAITNIGKVADIFETSMLKIGSAINTVGAKSSASEAFQQEFLFRTAGIGKQSEISAAQLLGFGAALDINGQQVEASSTALNTFFIDFIKNSDKFGKAAGFAKGELGKMINEKGVNESFLTFLETLKKTSKGSDDFLAKLEQIGIDGARGSATFLALSNDIDLVREQQQIATKAFEEGISITEEYDKKNNNFAATVAKIGKEWGRLMSSSSVQEFLTSGGELTLKFLKALGMLPEAIQEYSSYLIALTGVYVTYNASLIAATLSTWANAAATTASNAAMVVARAATAAYTLAKLVLTGQISLATAATWAFGAATAAATGGLTLILGALAAVGTAIAIYVNEQRQSLAISRMLNDVRKEAAKNAADEKASLESLLAIAKDETIAKEKREEALKKIIALNPEYLKGLTLENLKTAEGTKLINDYVTALDKKALAEAVAAKRSELSKKLIDEESKSIEDNIKWYDYLGGTLKGVATAGLVSQDYEKTGADRKKQNIDLIKKEIDALNGLYKEKVKSGEIDLGSTGGNIISGVENAEDGKGRAAAEKKANSEIEAFMKFQQKLLDLKAQSEAALRSADEKEIEDVKIKYAELQRELQGFHDRGVIDLNKFNATQKLINEDYYNELERLNKKHFANRSENEYKATLVATQNYYDREIEQQKQAHAEGLINENQYHAVVGELTKQAFQAKALIAFDYKDTVKSAEQDIVNFNKQAYDQDVKNKLDAEARKREGQRFAGDLALDTAQTNGDINQEFSIKRRMLDEWHAEQVQKNIDNNIVLDEIQANYNAQSAELDRQQFSAKAQQYTQYAQQVVGVLNSISQIASNIENAELARSKKATDAKIKGYDRELKEKRISQAQHDKLVEAANKQQAQKEDEIKRKQFERNKAMQIITAVINTAAAVASAWGTSGNIYAAIAMSVIAAAAGAAQIGVIASQQYQGGTYEEGTDSLAKGARHKDGGIKLFDSKTGMFTGQEIEGDEAIISRDTTAANYSVIKQLLNAKGKPINLSGRVKENIAIFANGTASLMNASATAAPEYSADNRSDTATMDLMAALVKTNQAMLEQMKLLNKKELVVSIQEINQKEELLDYIINKQL
jgi:hypothetical protein